MHFQLNKEIQLAELSGLQQQAVQLPNVNTTHQVDSIRQFLIARTAFLESHLKNKH